MSQDEIMLVARKERIMLVTFNLAKTSRGTQPNLSTKFGCKLKQDIKHDKMQITSKPIFYASINNQ